MSTKGLAIGAIVLSGVAMVWTYRTGKGLDRVRENEQQIRTLEGEVGQLETRLARLLQVKAPRPKDLPSDLEKGHEIPATAPLEEEVRIRQRRLEKRLADLGVLEHFEERKKMGDEAYELVLDLGKEKWMRLRALTTLREMGRVDDLVVAAMMPLWEDSLEEEKGGDRMRWVMLENLRGTTHEEFRTKVLDWIGTEESAKMRGQGVRTLIPMLPEPNVEEWLRHLQEHDPEPWIRDLAKGALGEAAESGE